VPTALFSGTWARLRRRLWGMLAGFPADDIDADILAIFRKKNFMFQLKGAGQTT